MRTAASQRIPNRGMSSPGLYWMPAGRRPGAISSSRCQTTTRAVHPRRKARIHFDVSLNLIQRNAPGRTINRTSIGSKPSPSNHHRQTSDWWSQTGSNRRPPACKAGALPAELWPRTQIIRQVISSDKAYDPTSLIRRYCCLVGLGGLEPPTSRLSSARSNQLSYKPDPKQKHRTAVRRQTHTASAARCHPAPKGSSEKKEKRRRRRPAIGSTPPDTTFERRDPAAACP